MTFGVELDRSSSRKLLHRCCCEEGLLAVAKDWRLERNTRLASVGILLLRLRPSVPRYAFITIVDGKCDLLGVIMLVIILVV